MESLRYFLDVCNNVMRKCNHDTSHPRWLQFRFNVAAGTYRTTEGREWDNRRRLQRQE